MADRLQEQRAPVRLLAIDNYDSFTFNLVQYLGELGAQVEVVRNDVEKVDELLERDPAGVVISPGPGEPRPPAYLSRWFRPARNAGFRCWASASATSPLVSRLGGRSFAPVRSCTGKCPRLNTMGAECFGGLHHPSRQPVIIRW